MHTTREYAHLPFDRTYSEHYQEWLIKDDFAQGYQDRVIKHGIKVWTGTTAKKGTWNSAENRWTLDICKDGRLQPITCSYIILAGGAGCQVPVMPDYPSWDLFQGQILH